MNYQSLISPIQIVDCGLALAMLTFVLILLDLFVVKFAIDLDQKVGKVIIGRRTRSETHIMHLFSWWGGPYGVTVIAFVYMAGAVLFGLGQTAKLFAGTVILSTIYALLVKLITARKRPKMKALELERTYSFPSAHILVSTVVYLSCMFTITQHSSAWVGFSGVLATVSLLYFIGMSRIYLGCHYASDVIAGFMGGLVWTGIFIWISNL